jgi:hypothetical protein
MSNQAKLSAAMLQLVSNPAFEEFIAELREMKDQAVRDLVSDGVIGDPSKVLAAGGSIRTYLDILDLYQNFADNPKNVVDEEVQQ